MLSCVLWCCCYRYFHRVILNIENMLVLNCVTQISSFIFYAYFPALFDLEWILLSVRVHFQHCSASHSYTFYTYLHTWELPSAIICTFTVLTEQLYLLPALLKGTLLLKEKRKGTATLKFWSWNCVLGKHKEWADFDIKQCKPFPVKTHLRMQAREFVSWMTCLAATYTLLLALFIFYLFELIELSLRLFEPVKALPSFFVSANNRGKWPCAFLIWTGLIWRVEKVPQHSFASAN